MGRRLLAMPMNDHDSRPHGGAFFGRRKGHPLRAHQASLMQTLLPRLAVGDEPLTTADLAVLFHDPRVSYRLEIGFGGGEHLLAEAHAHPDVGFIGCEAFENGMAKTLAGITAAQIDNIRLHYGDASTFLPRLPDHCLARVDLLYPDPWPKRRHWKRRFVQDASITEIARLLVAGGEFRFATDWPDYAAWTLERLIRSPAFAWTAERADDWRQPWPGFTPTRYEAKAKRAGRTPCYLIFRRS
jgi:tRNA (guanine-N7-)-methyltransferase